MNNRLIGTFISASFFILISAFDAAYNLEIEIFNFLILSNIFFLLLQHILNKKITFELFFISFIILFIFTKPIAGFLTGDSTRYLKIVLFNSIDFDTSRTKLILSIYVLVAHIATFIGIAFDNSRQSKISNHENKIFNAASIGLVNNIILITVFIIFIPIQISFVIFIFENGYLALFNSDEFWGLSMRDLLTRTLYVCIPIRFILEINSNESTSKTLITILTIFIISELLTGQRGHAVLLLVAMYIYYYLKTNEEIALTRLFFYGFLSLSVIFFIDIVRSSEVSDSFLITALEGFGNPLNTHQIGFYFENELRDLQNSYYSLYGINDYVDRVLNPALNEVYLTRSSELLEISSYLGHKLTYLINYNSWLGGYGTASSFLLELYIDFGLPVSIIVLSLLIVCFKFLENFVRNNSSILMSLIFITFIQYLLFIPRGSISNFFPTLIFTLFVFLSIAISSLILQRLKNLLNKIYT